MNAGEEDDDDVVDPGSGLCLHRAGKSWGLHLLLVYSRYGKAETLLDFTN